MGLGIVGTIHKVTTMDVKSFLRADLRDLVYHGVETLAAIAAEVGIEESKLVKVR